MTKQWTIEEIKLVLDNRTRTRGRENIRELEIHNVARKIINVYQKVAKINRARPKMN